MRLYHGTDVALQPGDVLAPNSRRNYDDALYPVAERVVYLTADLVMAFFYAVLGTTFSGMLGKPRVYEVEAPDARRSQPGEWVVPEAIVVAEVTAAARSVFTSAWQEMRDLVSAFGVAPSTERILVHEFERAMG